MTGLPERMAQVDAGDLAVAYADLSIQAGGGFGWLPGRSAAPSDAGNGTTGTGTGLTSRR
jgi:hypothetical protein